MLGLPTDVTPGELLEFVRKCGLVKKDTETGEYMIKVYKDELGRGKGDALVIFFRRESVDLAFKLIDESEIRPGYPVKITEVHHLSDLHFNSYGPIPLSSNRIPTAKWLM